MPSELARLGLAELPGSLGASGSDDCGSVLGEWSYRLSDHGMLSA
jgi:hypothetical protein